MFESVNRINCENVKDTVSKRLFAC